jgi:hypothetical protein
LKIPGRKLVGKAEEIGNVVGVPMTRGLGLCDLLKRTFKEARPTWKRHLLSVLCSASFLEEFFSETGLPVYSVIANPEATRS